MPRLLPWLRRAPAPTSSACRRPSSPTTHSARFRAPRSRIAGTTVAVHGEAAYNGVAILSRLASRRHRGNCRRARVPRPRRARDGAPRRGIRVIGLRAQRPASPESDHYAYKLAWLAGASRPAAPHTAPPMVLRRHEHRPRPTPTCSTPAPTSAIEHRPPNESGPRSPRSRRWGSTTSCSDRWPEERVFSYWDYRAGMFHQDMGMRIDLILANGPVAGRVRAAWIDRHARKGRGPSDHAPVIVDLDEAPDGDIGPSCPAAVEPGDEARRQEAPPVPLTATPALRRRQARRPEARSERRPAARARERLGPATVGRGDGGDDRESQPAPAAGPGTRGIDPEEAVEDVPAMLGGDAGAGVLDVDPPVAALRGQPDDDPRALRGVAARVREQVADRLAQAPLVAAALRGKRHRPAGMEQGMVRGYLREHRLQVDRAQLEGRPSSRFVSRSRSSTSTPIRRPRPRSGPSQAPGRRDGWRRRGGRARRSPHRGERRPQLV